MVKRVTQGEGVWYWYKDSARHGIVEAAVNFDGLYPIIDDESGRRLLRYTKELYHTQESVEPMLVADKGAKDKVPIKRKKKGRSKS